MNQKLIHDTVIKELRDIDNYIDDDRWNLLCIIASLHNELYNLVNGEYYDYAFHWSNKAGCMNIEDDLFKDKEDD